jgi:antitoxin ParD1/3/4
MHALMRQPQEASCIPRAHPQFSRSQYTNGASRRAGCPAVFFVSFLAEHRVSPNQDRCEGRSNMNVSLTPELERLVNEKVESGLYQTASEVVREALRLLKERDQAREQLRADVQAGFDQLARDESRAFDKTSGLGNWHRGSSRAVVRRAPRSRR